MRLVLEIVVALFFHPVAVVLSWINIATRADMTGTKKLLWAIVCIIWGIGPILYVHLADGAMW